MMNALYSWLQEEVKVQDLTDYIYWFELNMTQNSNRVMAQIAEAVTQQIQIDPAALLDAQNIRTETVDTDPASVHAQYNPNTQTITINNEWLQKYEQIMDAKQAYNLHFMHEVYHVIEMQGVWYDALKYRQRHRISEVSAIYYSQLQSGCPVHPRIAEYVIAIHEGSYTKETLATYLKERVQDYEIYRFAQ